MPRGVAVGGVRGERVDAHLRHRRTIGVGDPQFDADGGRRRRQEDLEHEARFARSRQPQIGQAVRLHAVGLDQQFAVIEVGQNQGQVRAVHLAAPPFAVRREAPAETVDRRAPAQVVDREAQPHPGWCCRRGGGRGRHRVCRCVRIAGIGGRCCRRRGWALGVHRRCLGRFGGLLVRARRKHRNRDLVACQPVGRAAEQHQEHDREQRAHADIVRAARTERERRDESRYFRRASSSCSAAASFCTSTATVTTAGPAGRSSTVPSGTDTWGEPGAAVACTRRTNW